MVTIRHGDLNDPALRAGGSNIDDSEARKARHEWWNRWESLPSALRDRPGAEVLAEQRQSD